MSPLHLVATNSLLSNQQYPSIIMTVLPTSKVIRLAYMRSVCVQGSIKAMPTITLSHQINLIGLGRIRRSPIQTPPSTPTTDDIQTCNIISNMLPDVEIDEILAVIHGMRTLHFLWNLSVARRSGGRRAMF